MRTYFLAMYKFKLFGALVFSLFLFACEDDDILPDSATNCGVGNEVKSSSLIGKWNAFEILGDDGRTYGLNMFVPKPDSTLVPGCAVFNYQESYLEYSYNFSLDSSVEFVYKSTDQDRLYTVIDSSACQFAYQAWFTSHYLDTSYFTFEEITKDRIIIWEKDSLHKIDTVGFTLENDILKLDNNPNFKFEL